MVENLDEKLAGIVVKHLDNDEVKEAFAAKGKTELPSLLEDASNLLGMENLHVVMEYIKRGLLGSNYRIIFYKRNGKLEQLTSLLVKLYPVDAYDQKRVERKDRWQGSYGKYWLQRWGKREQT